MVHAEQQAPRPVMSAPFSVANAQVAHDEVRSRWLAAQEEQQRRFGAFEGKMDAFVRSDPIVQVVSWSYDSCIDPISFIPPPLDGWGLRSQAPFTTNPVEETRTEVSFVTYDLSLASDHPDFHASERSVQIRTGISPDSKVFWEMALSQPAMRDAMLKPGPYDYPVTIADGGTLLGDVLVSVFATNEADKQAYLELIIGCAIENDMIAEGVDPVTLKGTP
jgi:hypothetical protein